MVKNGRPASVPGQAVPSELSAPRRVALVTCAEVPDLDQDTRLLVAPLAARGVAAVPAVWDDPDVDWSSFDLAIVRSCWDYSYRRDPFLAWAGRVPRLANPAHVLAWNTDKRYLQRLAARGIPVVPTTWLAPGEAWHPPEHGEWVVKPTVSLASLDTGRYRCAVAEERHLAAEHLRRLHAAGRTAMVQPYLSGVDTRGETSLIFLGGVFSHAIRRAAALSGPDTGVDRRFAPGGGLQPRPVQPTAAELALATRVLAATLAPPTGLLYSRVDLIPGPDGSPILIEIELTEPQLFLGAADGIADRMADSVVTHIHALRDRTAGTVHPCNWPSPPTACQERSTSSSSRPATRMTSEPGPAPASALAQDPLNSSKLGGSPTSGHPDS